MNMTLGKLFEELAFDELSTLVTGLPQSGRLLEEKGEQITSLVNSALLRLYSRFTLKESEVIIDLLDNRTTYPLEMRYARSQWYEESPHPWFIRDTEDCPFQNDVIRILSVVTDTGKGLPMNDPGLEEAAFTPRPDVLQIPCVEKYTAVSVIYQARHPVLNHEFPEEEVDLPDVLWPALRAWVAHRVFSAIGTETANAKSQEHFIAYQNLVKEVEDLDLVTVSRSVTTCKFESNGWV